MDHVESAVASTSVNCKSCGAVVHFKPGTHTLVCEYCHSSMTIDNAPAEIHSYDLGEFLEGLKNDPPAMVDIQSVSCKNCGATTTLSPSVTSDKCPFCATPLLAGVSEHKKVLPPHYVLPFIIDQSAAVNAFQSWLKKLWFAPNDLMSKVNERSAAPLNGIYIPHWTYDANTVSRYEGQRGDHYYVTETYTENGQTKTRSVRHTRWSYASGIVSCDFTDVMVSASPSLPQNVATTLEPWDLRQLVRFDERYFSGFLSEAYRLDATGALAVAKQKMQPVINEKICWDIGGDVQQINHCDNTYNNIAIKYIMLPVWISSYRYNDKLYQFFVNACTGEVTGDRPWSWIKITLAVLFGIALLVVLFQFFQSTQ